MVAFDLDAYVASQDPGPFVFTFGGQEWTWPPQPDLRSVGHLIANPPRVVDALELMFKPADWERFIAHTGGGLNETAIVELFQQHAKHAGSSLGESSASSGSSKSTARPSKPTSKSGTRSTSARSSRKAGGAASAS